MKYGRSILAGTLVFAAFACSDEDAKLKHEFHAASLALAEGHDPEAQKAVEGRDGWVLHSDEVRYLTAGTYVGENASQINDSPPPEYADPVPAIVGFHKQLKELGIQLYFVPIPERPVIYPESVLGSEPFAGRETIPNLHPFQQQVVSVLQENGVHVFDLTETLLNQRTSPKGRSVYLRSETHWTPYGINLAVRALVAKIKEEPWFEGIPKQKFSQRWIPREHYGGSYQDFEAETGKSLEPDQVSIRRVWLKTDEGGQRIVLHNPQSPVIVMGDSNTIFWSNFDSSLPHHLAFELGFPVDMLSSSGGGANETRINLVRKIRSEPEYLEGKRLVIWCLSARTFTNARQGWIPVEIN